MNWPFWLPLALLLIRLRANLRRRENSKMAAEEHCARRMRRPSRVWRENYCYYRTRIIRGTPAAPLRINRALADSYPPRVGHPFRRCPRRRDLGSTGRQLPPLNFVPRGKDNVSPYYLFTLSASPRNLLRFRLANNRSDLRSILNLTHGMLDNKETVGYAL